MTAVAEQPKHVCGLQGFGALGDVCPGCMVRRSTVEVEPVLVVEREPDYWSGGHFHKGIRSHIDPTKVWDLPIGTKLYLHPVTEENK